MLCDTRRRYRGCGLDLITRDSADALVRETLDCLGRIDALRNVAGAVPQIDLLAMTGEQWAAGAGLRLHGAKRVTLSAWEALKQSSGWVDFLWGSAALDSKPAFAAVAASKAAILAVTKAFAEHGIGDGV